MAKTFKLNCLRIFEMSSFVLSCLFAVLKNFKLISTKISTSNFINSQFKVSYFRAHVRQRTSQMNLRQTLYHASFILALTVEDTYFHLSVRQNKGRRKVGRRNNEIRAIIMHTTMYSDLVSLVMPLRNDVKHYIICNW